MTPPLLKVCSNVVVNAFDPRMEINLGTKCPSSQFTCNSFSFYLIYYVISIMHQTHQKITLLSVNHLISRSRISVGLPTLLRSRISVGSLFCRSCSLLNMMIFLLDTTMYSFFHPCLGFFICSIFFCKKVTVLIIRP